MRRPVINKEAEKFIVENRLIMSSRELAAKLNCSKFAIQRWLTKHNLTPPKEVIESFRVKAMRGRTNFRKSEDEKIKAEYLTKPIKVIAAEIGRSYTGIMGRINALGLELPQELRQQRKRAHCYLKGAVPSNKGKKMPTAVYDRCKGTMFKKGQISHNKLPLGSIRVTKDGYQEIKVAEPNKWKALHRDIWEETFGAIPKGGIIRFVTDDKMNVQPFNLMLIDRRQHMKKNSVHNHPKEIANLIQLRGALNRKINRLSKQVNA